MEIELKTQQFLNLILNRDQNIGLLFNEPQLILMKRFINFILDHNTFWIVKCLMMKIKYFIFFR